MSKRLHLYSYSKDYSIILKRFTQWMSAMDQPLVPEQVSRRRFGWCVQVAPSWLKLQPMTNLNPHLPLMAASSSFMMGFIWIFLDN